MTTQLIEDEFEFEPPLPVIVVNELQDDGGIEQAYTLSAELGPEPCLFSVGRDASCHVCLNHPSVSRDHATIGGCPHAPTEGHRPSLILSELIHSRLLPFPCCPAAVGNALALSHPRLPTSPSCSFQGSGGAACLS
jgi:hypothetical protein